MLPQLPRQLRSRLEAYYEILFPGGHAFDDDDILSSLSGPLLEEVSRHKCDDLLKQASRRAALSSRVPRLEPSSAVRLF